MTKMMEKCDYPGECAIEALNLYLRDQDVMDEDDFVKVMIGEMTVNAARSKMGFPPLTNPAMDKLIIVDLVGICQIMRPDTVHKAAVNGKEAYAKFLRGFTQDELERREAYLYELFTEGRITEDIVKLLSAEHMLSL